MSLCNEHGWCIPQPECIQFTCIIVLHCMICISLGDAYNAHDRCVCAGYDNGDIKLFDLRKMALRWETNIKNGVRLISFIYLSCMYSLHVQYYL